MPEADHVCDRVPPTVGDRVVRNLIRMHLIDLLHLVRSIYAPKPQSLRGFLVYLNPFI